MCKATCKGAIKTETVKVGVIGCGVISGTYLGVCKRFSVLEVVAVADLDEARARAKAEAFGVPKVLSPEALLEDPEVELVLNLTVPSAHAAVSRAALEAGKSVYSEKPLAVRTEDGRALLEAAARRGLRVGCAPDTFLGGGLQTCRKLLDEGWIGQPLAATAFMMSSGPESWHPDPAFFYKVGAGPMFDMGPYYLTALVNLMGPVRRVAGSAVAGLKERLVTSQPLFGTAVAVETPTHVTALLDFASGAVGTLLTSFDAVASELPRIEIYGTEGTLSLPDPNTFGGPVRVQRRGAQSWSDFPLTHPYTANSRGLGMADMAYALRSGRPHRASGELALHVLDAMQSVLTAAQEGRHLELSSTCERPAPLPLGLLEGTLDP